MPMSPRLLRPRTRFYPLGVFAATAGFSSRRLRAPYTGFAVRVRRSSDNAEKDFTSEEIANAAVDDWIGSGNDGFVTTWYDQTGNSNNVTQSTSINQPKLSGAQKRRGRLSLLFDGTNDSFVGTTGDAYRFPADFTVELWLHISGYAASAGYALYDGLTVGGAGARNNSFALAIDTAGKLYTFHASSIRTTSVASVPTGRWVHIALTRAGDTVRQFIDGTIDGTFINSINLSTGGFLISRIGDGTGYNINGYVDDYAVTKGTARYTANFNPSSVWQ